MPTKTNRRAGLLGWLTHSDVPIFVLDAKRRVRFVNQGCEALTGCRSEQLVGQVCTYSTEESDSLVDRTLQRLCPPPAVFDGVETEVPMSFESKNGSLGNYLVHYLPLKEGKDEPVAIFSWISPVPVSTTKTTSSPAQLLHAELASLRLIAQQRFSIANLISESEAMKRVAVQMESASQSNTALHFWGEAGTGREALARAVHQKSRTETRVFVPIDCGRLPTREIKKTFQRIFQEQANSGQQPESFQPGTLFLRDAHKLKRELQTLLVEEFQKQNVKPEEQIRIMSASTENLKSMVEQDEFESTCYYLLTPMVVEIPPLRDRRKDIPLLAQAFLEEQNRYGQKQIAGFAPDVLQNWQKYNWPGNLVELKAVIAEICNNFTGTGVITMNEMPFRFRTGWDAQSLGPSKMPKPVSLEEQLATFEKEKITEALQMSKGNKSQAAKLLGMTRPKFYRRLETLGLTENEAEESE